MTKVGDHQHFDLPPKNWPGRNFRPPSVLKSIKAAGGKVESYAEVAGHFGETAPRLHHSHIVLDISANQSKGHADVPNQGVRHVHRSDSADRLFWL